jgi:hypothetical protein
MPIQENISNPVLAAYIRGNQEKDAGVQEQIQNEEKRKAQEFQQQQLEEQHQQHLDLLDRTAKQFDYTQKKDKAEHDLAIQTAINQITENYLKTGAIPGNAASVSAEGDKNKSIDLGRDIGILGLPDRTKVATEQAGIDRISGAPKAEFQSALAQQKLDATAELANQKNQTQSAIKEADRNATERNLRTKAALDFDNAMKLQINKNQNNIDVAHINADAGLARVQAGQAKLSQQDADKLRAIENIQRGLTKAKSLLDQSNYSFFQGPMSGLMTSANAALNGEQGTDKEVIDALGDARQSLAVESGGKNFTPTEKAMLDTHVIEPRHTINANDAKTSIEDLIARTEAMKGDIYTRYSPSATKAPAATTAPTGTDKHIFYDANGKRLSGTK